jgi:hypothetical protein
LSWKIPLPNVRNTALPSCHGHIELKQSGHVKNARKPKRRVAPVFTQPEMLFIIIGSAHSYGAKFSSLARTPVGK